MVLCSAYAWTYYSFCFKELFHMNKQLKFQTILLMVLIGCISNSYAQVFSLNTAGGTASGNTGSVNYTVGQLTYVTHTGINGSVAAGVQQIYEISVISGLEEPTAIMLSVYPNPTIDFLTLEVKDFENSLYLFQLLDIRGKVLKNEHISNIKTSVQMANFNSGIYFLRISTEQKEIKTFKIIKK
jgi:hypothetical protein